MCRIRKQTKTPSKKFASCVDCRKKCFVRVSFAQKLIHSTYFYGCFVESLNEFEFQLAVAASVKRFFYTFLTKNSIERIFSLKRIFQNIYIEYLMKHALKCVFEAIKKITYTGIILIKRCASRTVFPKWQLIFFINWQKNTI